MHLAYCGAPFHGWQRQPNASSVQQTVEEALGTILRRPTPIVGAGRTDTGVNARMMIAHLDLPDDIEPDALVRPLNTLTGPNIAIYSIRKVHDDAHARFDAVSRTYRYYVNFVKTPFLNSLSWHSPKLLDFQAMNEAAKILLHTSDFTSFAKLHSDAKTNICHVTEARWIPSESELAPGFYFQITADRFLRNMVRAIVGTLIEVGRGKISAEEFHAIIERRNRSEAGTSMPAHALFLWDIKYAYLTL